MIPGSNILKTALSVIVPQTVTYLQYTGRTLNNVGQQVTTYAAPVYVSTGSFQPVPKRLYYSMGLDFQKQYYNWFVQKGVIDISRGVAGDQIVFNGGRFQCESNTDWFAIDGWDQVLCVYIGQNSTLAPIFGFNEAPQINDNVNFDNGSFADAG